MPISDDSSRSALVATIAHGPAGAATTSPIRAVNLGSKTDLIVEDHPALNHNGGTIAFGPDGDLY